MFPNNHSRASNRNKVYQHEGFIESYGNMPKVAVDDIPALSKTPVFGHKRTRNRAQSPSCQTFNDRQVLLWIQHKEAERREENRKKRAMERARREAESAADLERKRRAALAAQAFNNWLLQKARDMEMKGQSAVKKLGRAATGPETLAASPQDDSLGNFTKSKKRTPLNYKAFEIRDGANDKGEKQTSLRIKPCTRTRSISPAKTDRLLFTQTVASPKGEGIANCETISVIKTSEKMVEVGTETESPFIPSQKISISAQASSVESQVLSDKLCKRNIQSSKLTHKDWLRQKYFEAEIAKQARLEARQRLAFMEQLDPKLMQTWTEFLKSRCLKLSKQQHETGFEKQMSNFSQTGSLQKPMKQIRRTCTSLSESDVSSKRSLISCENKSPQYRRRFCLKLPNLTIFASENQRPHTSLECTDSVRAALEELMLPVNHVTTTTTASSCVVASIIQQNPEWSHLEFESELFEVYQLKNESV